MEPGKEDQQSAWGCSELSDAGAGESGEPHGAQVT